MRRSHGDRHGFSELTAGKSKVCTMRPARHARCTEVTTWGHQEDFGEHMCLNKTKKGGLCAVSPSMVGSGRRILGEAHREGADRRRGDLAPKVAAMWRVLGCGAVFLSMWSVGHEINLVSQEVFFK